MEVIQFLVLLLQLAVVLEQIQELEQTVALVVEAGDLQQELLAAQEILHLHLHRKVITVVLVRPAQQQMAVVVVAQVLLELLEHLVVQEETEQLQA